MNSDVVLEVIWTLQQEQSSVEWEIPPTSLVCRREKIRQTCRLELMKAGSQVQATQQD
mgnify:CR=1 FL=1